MTCLVQNTSTPSVGDSNSGSGWAPLYGGGTHLDQEAIQYIHKFYCKDCRMEEEKAKAAAAAAGGDSPQGGGDTSDTPSEQPISPQAMLEEMSLQQSMDKNKESLKRKLMMRRSVSELVDQGIYPPLKTPPAFAEQRKHLERAKTGDLLRHKIIHRPDRQLLVQQHILEDTKIDPSLHERQRLLKRARLADDLNEKLLHRPGPLDLIRGNILKTEDDMLTDAITDGVVQLQVPDNKEFHFVFDDDSSEGAPSPSHTEESGMSDIGSPPVVPPAPDPPPLQLKTRQTTITAPTLTKMSPLNTQSIAVLSTPITTFSGSLSSSSSSKNGNSGNGINKVSRQKKSKPKTSSKSKVIKFHEYKGPPSASKSQVTSTVTVTTTPQSTITSTPPTSDTQYQMMLQQQQMFLQWQLEFQQKNLPVPVTLLPQPKVESGTAVSQSVAGSVVITSAISSPPTFVSSSPTVVQAQGVVPAQGLLPPQNVVPAQGMLSTPTVVPAQGLVPSQVATTVVSTSLLQGQPATVPHTNTVIKHQIQPQPAQLQAVSQPQVQKVQQVQVQSGQSVVQKPVSQVRTHTHSVSQNHHPKSQSKSNHVVQKPFSNLEDMKVADLKLELKKRNLPVSGPKPQLIERLKPYVDVIIGVAQGTVNTSVANDNSLSLVKRPVPTIISVKSVPLTPLDEAVCMQSPPCSPKTEVITSTPLSPEIMDIAQSALNAQNKGGPVTLSQSSIPMAVDNSRPPSVDITMDTDAPLDIRRYSPTNVSQTVTAPVSATVTSPQSQPQTQPSPQPQSLKANSPSGAAPQISSEILLQQQRRIAQLQKELEESQMRLKLQQMQHQHLQQQQRHLQQQQTTHLTQQPASPPQLSQQPNSPSQVIQQIVQQPTSPPQFMQPSPQPTPPPQILHAMTSQPNSPPLILQQPLSPPQSIQQPISPPQLLQQPISPPQLIQQPLSPPQMLTTVTLGDGKISPIPNSMGMTKLVQIPSQSLHSMIGNPPVLTTAHGIQLAHHGIPTVMVATSTASDKQGAKPNLSDFIKTQPLHQSLNIVKPGTSASGAMFKQPTFLVTSGAKTITLTAPLNGLATTRTTSLPSSPVEGKMSLGRTMSNPFFVPQKEPPKYDEAVRSKQHSQQGSGVVSTELSNGTVPNKIAVKSQAMDDVLEILIRTGELPPSAAQEPPPTPKTTTQTSTIPTSGLPTSVSMTTATTTTTTMSYSVTSSEQYTGLSSTYTATSSLDSAGDNISVLLNSPQQVSSLSVKQESMTPPPLMVNNVMSPDTSTHDLLDINDYMLNQDLNSMDWTSDQAFTLDLNDTTSMQMQTDQEMKCDGVNDFLNVPLIQGGNKGAPHGSEPDLTGMGLTEGDNCANVQMDVSDWLDVIMPSTGLTPLSANPPVSFPSDPILTPKTQQEVLELFNFDDTDFNTPTDLHSGINWEKLTETTGSS